MNKFEEYKNKVDWGLVLTLIVTALILALIVWGMKQTNIKSVKQIAANV